jgi:hypothetical protein
MACLRFLRRHIQPAIPVAEPAPHSPSQPGLFEAHVGPLEPGESSLTSWSAHTNAEERRHDGDESRTLLQDELL